MIFVCRGVAGYNDCVCCCSCCIGDNQVHAHTVDEKHATSEEITVVDNLNTAVEYGEYQPDPERKGTHQKLKLTVV